MGRELRRVPLDFDWPLNERWKGYMNPHYHKCEVCDGRGEDKSRLFVEAWIRALCLAAEESCYTEEQERRFKAEGRRIYPHPYLQDAPFWIQSRKDLGDGLVDLIKKLSGVDDKELSGPMGFSSSVSWRIFDTLMKAAGLPEKWGYCEACKGEGRDPQYEEAYNAWESYDPPEGEGFQLWETTSEGSPVSPVFKTLAELCAWCEDNATVFGKVKASKEKWLEMLDSGFVYHREGHNLFF